MSRLKVNQLIPFNDFGIGIGGLNNEASAILNIRSTNQGVLMPRMTTAQRNLITSPKNGLLIYNLDNDGFEQYNVNLPGWESVNGLGSLNGLNARTQFFATGSAGTAPNWASSVNTHTLNIPLAHTSGVTSGTISKTEFDYFNSKQNAVKNIRYVTKNLTLGPQEFNSIKDAVDSITDASASNPYLVRVGPGVFVEDTITMQSYVWVQGAEQDQTIIEVNSTSKHVIVAADNSGISKCLLQGATDPGFAAIYYQSLTGTTTTSFFAEDVRFGHNDTLGIADGTNAATALFLENCKIGSVHQFNHGFLAMAGGRVIARNCTTTGLTGPLPDYVFKGMGSGSQIVINGMQIRSGSVTGNPCIHLVDGALLRASSVNIRMFGVAVFVENSGAPSFVDASGVLCEANTMDLVIDHPDADGTFTGSANHTKISINPSSTFSVVIACNKMPSDSTGSVTVGDILQGDRFDRVANLSLVARKATTLGLIEDVETPFVVFNTGLNVEVISGQGFVNEPTELYLLQVEWENTILAIPANSTKYIYVDHEGNVLSSDAPTDPETTILLGRVNSSASSIRFIENSDLPMNHYGNKTENFLRVVLGPTFVSGCIVSESVTPLKLDVTPGSYYFGVTEFFASGGNEITWETFYRDGLGDWSSMSNEDTISNSLYDDNSGTLASIPAGKYVRHHLYVVGDGGNEQWFLIVAQNYYDTEGEALAAPTPLKPSFFNDALTIVAGIVVQEGNPNVVSVLDLRIRPGQAAPSGTAVTRHSDLSGLLVDDHPQYLLINGTRPMSGPLNMNTQDITNAGLINGVTIQTHASRHLPNGADPITTAAPSAALSAVTANATGTANSLARSDHSHSILTAAAITILPDQANATGTSANLARADHVHQLVTAAPIGSLGPNSVNGIGIASSFARSDHTHAIATAAPITIIPDQANAAGSSGALAKSDHVHAIATDVPVTIGSANALGSSSAFSRSDHVHAAPNASIVPFTPSGNISSTNVGAALNELDSEKQAISEKGQPNGYASLDGSGKVPLAQLPDTVIGGVDYKGTWNANTNTPNLVTATPDKGDYYVVNVAGSTSLGGITDWQVGDWAIYNGTAWQKVDNTDQVASVFGRQGTVVAQSGDYTASQITNVPAGDISATNVQAALNELDTEKVPTTRTVTAGTGLTGGGDLSTNRTISMPSVGTAGTYGSAAQVAVITTDAQGRVTAAVSTSIAITSTAVTNFEAAVLATVLTGYTIGANTALAATDSILAAFGKVQGQIAARALSSITISAGTGLTGGGDLTANRTISMPNVGTAGTYGSATQVPVFTTDAQGRVSAVTNTAIQIAQSQVTGLVTDLSGKANLAGGNTFTGTQQINSGSFIIGGTTIQTSGEWNVAAGTYTDPDVGTLYDAKFGGPNRGIAVRGTSYFLAQVGIGAQTPVASAKLQVDSTTQGFLLPRMTAAQRQAIASPATGLQVFDTTTNELLVYNGTSWIVQSAVPTEFTATARVTTTSGTYSTISGMTTTPAAGTYKVEFTCSADLTGATNGDVALHIAAAEQTSTTRNISITTGFGTPTQASSVAFSKIITVNGSQVVDVRFRENGGATLGVSQRVLILTPISRT